MAFDPAKYIKDAPVNAGFDPAAYVGATTSSTFDPASYVAEQAPDPQWLQDANAGKTKYTNEDGSLSTVKTVGFEQDGKYLVAPSIRNIMGVSTSLTPEEAVRMAIQQGDAIPFGSQAEGDAFSQKLHSDHEKKFAQTPTKQTASEAFSSPDKRGIGEQLLSALFAPITPAARGVEALQALGAGGTEEETRGARAVNALLGREEVPAADVFTNQTGEGWRIARDKLPDVQFAKKMEGLKDPTGIGPLDAILNLSGKALAGGAGFGQNMLLEALLDPTSYVGIPGAKAIGKAATTVPEALSGAARGSTDDLLKGLVGGLGEGADVSPGAVIGGLDDGLEGAPRAAAEVLSPMSPLKQRIINLQEVHKGLQSLPPGTGSPAEFGAAQDMVRGIGLPPDSPKFPAIPMEGPKPTQLEQILQLEAPKSLPGARQVGVGTTEGMGILPDTQYDFPDEVKTFFSAPEKVPAEYLSKTQDEKSFIDGLVKREIDQLAFNDAKFYADILKQKPRARERFFNFWRRGFSEDGKNFAKEKHGGEIYQEIIQAHKFESQYANHLEGIGEQAFKKYEKLDDFSKAEMYPAIEKAIETGDTSGLKSPLQIELYDAWTRQQAELMPLMEAEGLPTIKDKGYLTWVQDNANSDPSAVFSNSVPGEINASFTKHRGTGDGTYLKNDLVAVMRAHNKKVLHKIFYDPVLAKVKKINETAGPNQGTSKRLNELIKKVVFPEQDPGGLFGWYTGMRYKAGQKWNPFSSLENRGQRHLGRAQVPGEANVLAKELQRPENMKVLGIEKDLEGGISGMASDLGDKYNTLDEGLFPLSEKPNWRDARANGLAQQIVQHPEYQKRVDKGMSRIDAAKEVIDMPAWSVADKSEVPQTVRYRGVRRAEDTATSTQFLNDVGNRPAFYELASKKGGGALKILTQYRRFDSSSFEAIKDLFTKAGKESRILRRGFSDEVAVVDALEARRLLRDGMKTAVKRGKVEKKVADILLPQIDDEIKRLEGIVKELEPTTKLHAAKEVGKFIGNSVMVRSARAGAKVGVFEMLKETGILPEDAKRASFQESLQSQLGAMVPGKGTAEFITDLTGQGDPSYGSNKLNALLTAIPGAGALEQSIPGRPISTILKHRVTKPLNEAYVKPAKKKLSDLVFGKEEKKRPERPTRPAERPTRPER